MVSDCNQSKEINDPTKETRLADPHDQMLFVKVMLADGKTEERPYEVHLPKGRMSDSNKNAVPVVLALDGTTRNKPYTGMAVDNNINDEADRDGFIVVYPLEKPRDKGISILGHAIHRETVRDWNAPGVGALPYDRSYNDEDYMKAVITDIKQKFHPQGGIHAAAESLGGEFLVKLDSDLPSGTFADNYIVSSTVFQTEGQPRPGIPVKIVRGEQDPILPATGGKMHPNINPITNTLVRWQVEDTDRTDQSCPPCMLQEFLKANDFSGPLPPKIDKGSYFETVYTVNGIHIVLDEVKNAGHYWFGRKKGGCHETLATGVNGINPPESAFDASADMARFFGLRQD